MLARHCAEKPILAVFVCLACGAFEAAATTRPWPVDRAMRRAGLGERDILAVVQLIESASANPAPELDAISAEGLRELVALVGHDVDLVALGGRVAELACLPALESTAPADRMRIDRR